MRKHGWQLPYHPLQVVAVAVFSALGVAFYVFFVPFLGRRSIQHLVMGIYTPLSGFLPVASTNVFSPFVEHKTAVTSVSCLYIWCAATDPGDPGVFRSNKYRSIEENAYGKNPKQSSIEGGSMSLKNEENIPTGKKTCSNMIKIDAMGEEMPNEPEKNDSSCCSIPLSIFLFVLYPLSLLWKQSCSYEQSSEQQSSEDGMFYCSLCEVEVFKYSKHCRVCDKCIDGFDHHCRWLNNCIGKKNYKLFFILMASALLLLILQWSLGIFVLIRCFLERKQFGVDIALKLGSSFSILPFIVVVVSCTFLAMIATVPLAQLLFFHILLIKKGLSTYDYIIALREQELQDAGGQQSPQMSPVSSFTGLSSASSFNTSHRGSWCTPPRLLQDQLDVIPPDSGRSKMMAADDNNGKKNNGKVKFNPWTLARLNAEEVSRAAAQARKRSKILQPVMRKKVPGQETDSSFDNSSGRMASRNDTRKRGSKRTSRLPADLPLEPLARISASATESASSDVIPITSRSLAPLQHEARSAFLKSRAISSAGVATSSPDSSLDSPDLRPFHASCSGPEEAQGLVTVTSSLAPSSSVQKGIELSRSTSDGYEASGGEDSDRVPSRIVHRSLNWNNLLFNSVPGDVTNILRATSSSGLQSNQTAAGYFDLTV